MSRIVTTQEELDSAISHGVDWVKIRSEPGVLITVSGYGSSTFTAFGSSWVTAYDSSRVTAYESSTVTAYDSSRVTAFGSSTVTTFGSSRVTAHESSTVTTYESSGVTACGLSTVTAFGSSWVTAYDSSTIRAYGWSTVRAKNGVAVHRHSEFATIQGGVIIDHTTESENPEQWCSYHDVETSDGIAYLYKALNDKWTTDHGFDYSPGETPSAPDWSDNNYCGGGLHLSPTPIHAQAYNPDATKFVKVGVKLETLRPILGGTAKAKAPAVTVACVEVDIDGNPVGS